MKVSTVSSLAINTALLSSTSFLQRDLVSLQKEVVNGRHADSGLALGERIRNLVSFRNDVARLERLIDTNNRIETRLKGTQEVMGNIAALGDGMSSAVGLAYGDEMQRNVVKQTAKNALDEAVGLLNTRVNGEAIFGGINSATEPLIDYEGSPLQAAVSNAFVARFGFAISDPAAATISGADMMDFLENDFKAVFYGPDWNLLSVASDEVQISRVADGVTAQTSVSANHEAFRDFFVGVVAAFEFSGSPVSGDALQSLSAFSVQNTGTGVGKMAEVRGQVGLTQARIARVNERLDAQSALMGAFATDMEQVDVFEKSAELNNAITQIEISYSVTSRVQQLTIMRFLS